MSGLDRRRYCRCPLDQGPHQTFRRGRRGLCAARSLNKSVNSTEKSAGPPGLPALGSSPLQRQVPARPRRTIRTSQAGSTTTASSIGRNCVRPSRGSMSMSFAGRAESSSGCAATSRNSSDERRTGVDSRRFLNRHEAVARSPASPAAARGRKRPRERRPAEKRDELAPFH